MGEFAGGFVITVNLIFSTAGIDKSQFTKKRITIMGISALVSAVIIYDGATRFMLTESEVRALHIKLEVKEKQLELENKILLNMYKGVKDDEQIAKGSDLGVIN
jgi:hypothetical protein